MGFGINITQLNDQTISLTGRVDQQHYETVLIDVLYENTAEEPGDLTRQILFMIIDTDGFISTATTTVRVIPTNDRPIITLAGTPRILIFDEVGRRPVSLFSVNDTITDDDGSTLEWLSIVLSPGIDTLDVLNGNRGTNPLHVNITTFSDGAISLNITGNANFAAYEEVLNSITFSNIFTGISQVPRIFQVEAFDGLNSSNIQNIRIDIGQFNDPPVCYFGQVVSSSYSFIHCSNDPCKNFYPIKGTPSSPAEFIEEAAPTLVAANFGLADFDSPNTSFPPFTVVLNMTNAIDGFGYEGLQFDTTETNVTVRTDTPTSRDPFTFIYTLEGSNAYSTYQSVCPHDSSRGWGRGGGEGEGGGGEGRRRGGRGRGGEGRVRAGEGKGRELVHVLHMTQLRA